MTMPGIPDGPAPRKWTEKRGFKQIQTDIQAVRQRGPLLVAPAPSVCIGVWQPHANTSAIGTTEFAYMVTAPITFSAGMLYEVTLVPHYGSGGASAGWGHANRIRENSTSGVILAQGEGTLPPAGHGDEPMVRGYFTPVADITFALAATAQTETTGAAPTPIITALFTSMRVDLLGPASLLQVA